MNDEVLKVLEMVKEGKITLEEGEKLLAALKQTEPEIATNTEPIKKKSKKSMLRIRIDAKDNGDDAAKVNVNVPLTLAKKAAGLLSLVPKDAKKELNDNGIDLDSIDIKELIGLFEMGEIDEEFVNIQAGDEEQNATVKIYVD